MNTKLITGAIVIFITLSNTAFADRDHHKDDDDRRAMPGMMMQGEMPMMDMKSMHEHMATMQKTMDRIHRSKDMKEQHELMQQHMKEMHQGMSMMGMMMSGDMKKEMPMGMRKDMPHDKTKSSMGRMDDDDMDFSMMRKRQMMMEQRMDMMQGMMGQMMEHMMQQEKMDMN